MTKDEHSNLRHLVTHERDDDKHKILGHWTHWTANGTFTLKSKINAGSTGYELFINDRLLHFYLRRDSAIDDVISGRIDQELGFSGKSSGLPDSVSKWNNR